MNNIEKEKIEEDVNKKESISSEELIDLLSQTKEAVRNMYGKSEKPGRPKQVISDIMREKINPYFESNLFTQNMMGEEEREKIIKDLSKVSEIKEKESFLGMASYILLPIMKLRIQNPELFKKIDDENRKRMEKTTKEFIYLNDKISYHISSDPENGNPDRKSAHIHLSEARDVKDKLPMIFLDGMKKLADIIKEDENVKTINATSWLMATEKYGNTLKSMGFNLEEISEELKEQHFKDEDRPIKRAWMSREDFLKNFLESQK